MKVTHLIVSGPGGRHWKLTVEQAHALRQELETVLGPHPVVEPHPWWPVPVWSPDKTAPVWSPPWIVTCETRQ